MLNMLVMPTLFFRYGMERPPSPPCRAKRRSRCWKARGMRRGRPVGAPELSLTGAN